MKQLIKLWNKLFGMNNIRGSLIKISDELYDACISKGYITHSDTYGRFISPDGSIWYKEWDFGWYEKFTIEQLPKEFKIKEFVDKCNKESK